MTGSLLAGAAAIAKPPPLPFNVDAEASLVEQALRAARTHLDMEIAYTSQFDGGETVFRTIDAPGLEHLARPGDRRALADVYCGHILAGRLPEMIPDTAAEPLAASMAITAELPIGSHVSVPLRLSDGRAHGMFCCLSPTPNRTLNPRDLKMVRAFAEMAVFDIERGLRASAKSDRRRSAVADILSSPSLTTVYQPIWSLSAERPVGYEALSRFDAEPRQPPDAWFADATEVGLGEELEVAAVARAVCALTHLPADAYLAVNVSPAVAMGAALSRALGDVPGGRLVLEITEHSAVTDYGALADRLARYRAGGVRIAVDDAGSGYAGLEQVVRLAPDILKLDRFLIDGIESDLARRSLAMALIRFARDTGATVVAEGVETLSQLTILRSLGVDRVQGYLLGRPASLAQIEASLPVERGLRLA